MTERKPDPKVDHDPLVLEWEFELALKETAKPFADDRFGNEAYKERFPERTANDG